VQILGNLVANACQAMPKGGNLSISAGAPNGDMIKIAVRDTGTGVLPENMSKLFEPLFTTKTTGIGLGLAVSRKLAEANSGRIEVQSEPGKGSTFTLVLPVYSS
jgi:signal transduction histidine kinase